MNLLREYIREVILEKTYDPPVEQDVVHGLDFTEMRQHLSRHFGKAKITLTDSPLDLERSYPPSTQIKPSGIWYGCGTEWLDFVEENDWQSTRGNQIWALKVDVSKVKSLIDPKQIDRFSLKYRDMESYTKNSYNKRIDWAQVQSDFSGIECCPYPVGDREFRYEHDWYYALDMSSGCIWDPTAISNNTLVAELLEDGWQVYV